MKRENVKRDAAVGLFSLVILAVAVALLAVAVVVEAQQKKIPKVGMLRVRLAASVLLLAGTVSP